MGLKQNFVEFQRAVTEKINDLEADNVRLRQDILALTKSSQVSGDEKEEEEEGVKVDEAESKCQDVAV